MPFSGLRPPMRSAMSAGTAIMAVVRAYDATGDVKYLDAGWHFAQEVLALGDANGDEIWFRHYHEAPWLRVLNSDLRTTYGLGFLVEATGDAELTAVYQRSLRPSSSGCRSTTPARGRATARAGTRTSTTTTSRRSC